MLGLLLRETYDRTERKIWGRQRQDMDQIKRCASAETYLHKRVPKVRDYMAISRTRIIAQMRLAYIICYLMSEVF